MSFSNSHILILWYLSGLLLSNLGAFDFNITQATLTDPTYMGNLGGWVSPDANVISVSNDQRTTNFIRPSFRGFDKLHAADAVKPDPTSRGSQQLDALRPPETLQSIAVVHKEEHMAATDPLMPATHAITTPSEAEPPISNPLPSQHASQPPSANAPAAQSSAVAQPEPPTPLAVVRQVP
jgi:hypothetical protein